jgi:hypothetical protein
MNIPPFTWIECRAKIVDEFGNKYKCSEQAVVNIITETFAPHLQRIVKKERLLCAHHAHRLRNKYNYQIKHCGKKCTITQQSLLNQQL